MKNIDPWNRKSWPPLLYALGQSTTLKEKYDVIKFIPGKKFIRTAPMHHMSEPENRGFLLGLHGGYTNFVVSCVCGTAGQKQSTG